MILTSNLTDSTLTEKLLSKEWLLTNKRGGFASSTFASCNTRRYHSLLTGSLHPPAQRIKSLACLKETILSKNAEIGLTNFEFKESPLKKASILPTEFRQDTGVHFEYDADFAKITKSIYMDYEEDRIAVVYDFSRLTSELTFIIRPFAAISDFHSLLKSGARFCSYIADNELIISSDTVRDCELRLFSDRMMFNKDENWWHNFYYRIEAQRGQDCLEDLWTPGYFEYKIEGPERIVLWASMSDQPMVDRLSDLDIDVIIDNIALEQKNILKNIKLANPTKKTLYLAADQFVTRRKIFEKETSTILAGFPWFLDWGRDSFISLRGLLLETGQFEYAKEVLCTFASAVDKGMIPNRFDDYNNSPHYNSIDASMWFINAAFEYLDFTNDRQVFTSSLLPVIKWIIEAYYNGTRFGICADTDSLITGGSADTQLTWMDAKCNGVTFTPRYGKAVEINALWHNNICRLADYYNSKDNNTEAGKHYTTMADEIEDSFRKLFWNPQLGCLYDCVLSDGTKDPSIRPNQIFAVSLKYSPLRLEEQEKIVIVVQKHLLTPFGLRTLSSADPRYQGRYEGDMFNRDKAYHQGTVWPWLIGPFIGAYLRVNNYSPSAKNTAMEMIKPLLGHLTDGGCIGSVSEIFDGDSPQRPNGCFAQAWSVAQLIEAYNLITT